MKSGVIVATYNEPDRLALVFEGLRRQSRAPDVITVADDGSGPETASVVERYRARTAVPIQHVWHADEGFRKWAVSNEAVRRTDADWLLFLDGDAVPHRHWVRDHLEASRRAEVLCGRRVKLGPEVTSRVDERMVASGELEGWFGPLGRAAVRGEVERFGLGLRVPAWTARWLHPRPRKLMGVNFSLSRAAFELVNGYDEEWPGRRGDRDLDLRLTRAGCRFAALVNRAVVYHLFHPERPNPVAIEERVLAEERSTRVSCRSGLVQRA